MQSSSFHNLLPMHTIAAACALALACWIDSGASLAQAPRQLNHLEFVSTDGDVLELAQADSTNDPKCTPLVDAPLWTLSVDTEPVDQKGQTVLDPAWTPPICPAPVMANVPTVYMGYEPAPFCPWPVWPGAQFCHRPLYFEEPCLERCGSTQCCQPAVSAAHFFCNAALLPVKMCQQPCWSCECTPPAF